MQGNSIMPFSYEKTKTVKEKFPYFYIFMKNIYGDYNNEVEEWVVNQASGRVILYYTCVCFEIEDDFILFKLTFG